MNVRIGFLRAGFLLWGRGVRDGMRVGYGDIAGELFEEVGGRKRFMSVSRSFTESGSPSMVALRWKAVLSFSVNMTKMMPINEIRKTELQSYREYQMHSKKNETKRVLVAWLR
jgi:hypothetical protein